MSPEDASANSNTTRDGTRQRAGAFGLRAASLPFPSFPPHLEAEFRREYNESSAPVAWFAVLLGEILYMAFYFWDRVVDYPHSTQTLIVRLAVFAWFLGVILVRRAFFARHLQAIVTPTAAIAGIGVVAIIFLVRDGMTIGLSGVVLVLMFNFGFFRLLFVPSLVSGVIICAAYNAAALIRGLPSPVVVANNFFLVSALLSGATVTYLLERLFRIKFLTERELAADREALTRQVQIDKRYLEWLRHLATFLRHEVRQPVAQITSSIDLIQSLYAQDDRLKPFATSASLAAQQVWNLVERASRATDAEAFVRQAAPRLIDLHELAAKLIEGCARTYSGIHIRLTANGHVWVRADPTLIKEAIENLLTNAASFAENESTVEVAIELDRTHALIKVRNAGPLLRDDPEALFRPFVSSRAGPASEHHGLGLYLVRLIAEQHGGSARIDNLADRSGVEASLALPLAG